MSIRKKNKVSRWLARLLILTICLTGVPIKNVYGEGDENNKVTYEWKKTLTHERMGDVEEIQVEYLSPTRDGGFIGIGSDTYSGLVFKLDNSRNVVWVKEYSGFGDEITDIQEKSSGGYVVLENRWWHMEGLSGCNGYIFELDENGEKIPERELQIGGSNRDLVEQIVQTNDGGYIVVGYEDSNDGDFSGNLGDYDCWVLKIDNNFNQVWLKNYGGEGQDKGVSIKEASDGGYVIFGTSIVIERPPDIPRNYSFWVFKIDEAGNVVWDKTYGGTRDDSSVSSDAIKSIDMKLTADGGYALLGSTTLNNGDITGNHGGQEYWFVKINKDGEKQFQKTYGGSGDDSPIGFIKSSGGYIIAGNSNSSDGDFDESQGNQDGWMIQIDESGEIIWKWNAATEQEDTIYSIQAGEKREIFISSKIGGTNEIAKLKVKNTNAYLTDLKVDGQTVSNFVYNKLSYNKELPYGTTTVPTVIGVAQDINAAVNITPAESLPGSTSIEVTAEDGEVTKTYTLAFTVAKNNNAYLQELKVDNTGVSGFSHNQYTYEKELPYGTTTVPTITATAQDTNAVVNITQATSLPGSTSIEVTAENGEVKKTYTIAFTVAKNNNAYLQELKVNNVGVSGFSHDQYTYEKELPYGTTTVPTVTATAQDTNTAVNITQATSLPGSTSIEVTAEDGEVKKTYTIAFTVAKNNNAYLQELKIDDVGVSGFSHDQYTYEKELSYGTTTVPTVTAKVQDANAIVNITQATSLPGSTSIEVTAENGEVIKTYTIAFTVAKNNNAYLQELKVDGVGVSGFSHDQYIYEKELPYGTTTVPTVTAKVQDANAVVNITQATSLPGTTTIKVIGENGENTKTYTIEFTVAKSNNAYLQELKVDNIAINGFRYDKYNYEKILPYGSTKVPTIIATAQDTNATINITSATSLPGTTRIEVIAEDGSIKNIYTIYFTVLKNTNAYLSNLKVNNETVTDFVYNQYTYEVKLPVGSTSIPEVTATSQDENAKVNITQATSLPGMASIKVIAEDGEILNMYTIYFTLEKSNNAYLNDLRVDGETVSGFVYNDYTYEVELPFGSVNVPTVTVTTQDENAGVNITKATSLPGITSVEIIAEDGKVVKTYEIKFTAKKKESGQDDNSNNNNSNSNSSSSDGSNNSQREEAKVSPLEKPKETLKKSIEILKNTQENKEEIIENSINTLNDVSKIIQEVDNPKEIADAVTIMIENTEQILSDPDTALQKREELKEAIVRLGEKAMEKAGQMQVPSEAVKVEGNTAKATISSQWLQKQIQNTEKNINSIKNALNNVIGEEAGEAKISLTVNMPKDMKNTKKVVVDFQREILTQIQNKNIDRIIFNMKYVGFTVEPDQFKNVKEQQKITLEEMVDNQNEAYLSKNIEKVKDMPILEINAKIQDEKIKSFKKPMEVYFNLSHLDLSNYSKEELESLTAYLYDEETKDWKAVGGKYDPATNRINVYRIHLSTYTVMKSNKTFSDIKKHSSEKEINLLLKKGILEDENEFMPNKEVSRAEFIGWVSKSFGLEEKEIDLPFEDVDPSNPNYKEIAAAFDQGLIQGKKDNIFAPKANITKQEAAVAITNALKKYEKIKTPKDKNPYLAQYNDQENIATWSKDAVAIVSQKRLSDNSENQYNPNKPMTRADAALMVYNVRDHL